jgi:hypothetical protein
MVASLNPFCRDAPAERSANISYSRQQFGLHGGPLRSHPLTGNDFTTGWPGKLSFFSTCSPAHSGHAMISSSE